MCYDYNSSGGNPFMICNITIDLNLHWPISGIVSTFGIDKTKLSSSKSTNCQSRMKSKHAQIGQRKNHLNIIYIGSFVISIQIIKIFF